MQPALEIVELTDSTNTQLLQAAANSLGAHPEVQGLVSARSLLAFEQSAGRGRRMSTWNASAGVSVCLSISQDWFDPSQGLAPNVSTLSLCLGVVAKECLDEFVARPLLRLKWPNDLLVVDEQGSPKGKIAGMLIEARSLSNGCWRVVVGIGVNLWTHGLHRPIQETRPNDGPHRLPAAGLFDGEPIPSLALRREKLVQVASTLAQRLHQGASLALQEGWSLFETRYAKSDCLIGRVANVYDQQSRTSSYEALVLGVAADGGLLVQYGSEKRTIYAADVSIRLSESGAKA